MSQFIPKNHRSKHKEKLIYFFAFATPMFMIPQGVEIFSTHQAQSVSLLTWAFFLLSDVVWATYGIKHKLLPLVLGHILYFIIEASVVIGILVYS